MKKYLLIVLIIFIKLTVIAQNNDAKLANEYYQQRELEKAFSIFETLEKERSAIPLIHANYLQLLIDRGDSRHTEKYLDRIIKLFPGNLQFQVDRIAYYSEIDDQNQLQKLIGDLKSSISENQYQLSTVAQHLASRQLYDEALQFYNLARKVNGRPSAYALDVAAIYRLQDNKVAMTEEYINYALGNPANTTYVKNLFQNILTEEEDQQYLEETLIAKSQKNPNEVLFSDLLIWLQLQRKNFYAAFIQARALDRRTNSPGDESMRIGRIAYENQYWEDAISIFEYLIDNYADSYNYAPARRYLIRAREQKVKNEFPIDTTAIRNLSNQYQSLYDEIGPNPTTLEALKNKALLHAFYLKEFESAIHILNSIVNNRRSPADLVAEAKLDLGDIYILTGETWESTLLYSQVEKAHKESPLGYEAKLRNAKLNYFTGNFSLAKSHLDILKLATTRTISNDAIALSLLISDNTAFDTTDHVMQEFATAELLIFTNQTKEAKQKLSEILTNNPGHSITDEVYWLQSKLALKAGEYEVAIQRLDEIIEQYSYDILSDDAYFQKGEIIHDYLQKDDQAIEIFREFLKRYPGSRHAADARRRIRELRGDLLN